MDAKELRRNNAVLFNGEVKYIRAIQSDDTIRLTDTPNDDNCHGCYILSEIDPIQLTQEWLLKFGFKRMMNGFLRLPLKGVFEESDYIETFDCENFSFGYYGGLIIDSVHRLQNFIFALTVEELTLNAK